MKVEIWIIDQDLSIIFVYQLDLVFKHVSSIFDSTLDVFFLQLTCQFFQSDFFIPVFSF